MSALAVLPSEQDRELSELKLEGPNLQERVKLFTIETRQDFEEAAELTRRIAARRALIREKLDPIVESAYRTHAGACKLRRETDGPFEAAEQILSRKLALWQARQRELERRREEEARRQAQEEAAAKQRELEEQQKREHEAAVAQAAADQQDRILAEAIRRDEEGDPETANLILDSAPFMPAPEVPAPPPVQRVEPVVPIVPRVPDRVAGISFRQNYKWEVTDSNLVPREYLKIDEAAINGVVRAMRDRTRIPGIRVFPEAAASISRKR